MAPQSADRRQGWRLQTCLHKRLSMRDPTMILLNRRCQRCGMRYPRSKTNCPHCQGLTDEQVLRIRARHRGELAEREQLGRLLFYVVGLLIVLMVIYALNKN